MRVAHLIRKPVSEGSVGRNVLKHGTGGINIDGTRIQHVSPEDLAKHKGMVDRLREKGGMLGGSWKNSSDLSGANPVAGGGRWPSNIVLIHDSRCRLSGTRPAPGYTINQWTDGAKPFGGGAGHPYKSTEIPEGVEEVWECVEGCPVRELDGQSGTGKSMPRVGWGGQHSDSVERGFSDAGGASRFFKQVKP